MRKHLGAVLFGLIALAACQAPAQSQLTGRWDVQQIAGASLGEDVEIWIEIDEAAGRASGYTGCNAFTASLTTFSETAVLSGVQEQNGDCPSIAAATDEARFLAVLPSIQRYIRNGRSLELLPMAQGSEALLRLRLSDAASD